jgi:hypothetical protein
MQEILICSFIQNYKATPVLYHVQFVCELFFKSYNFK